MEEVKCNICNSGDYYLLVVKNSFHVVKCKNCGLVYVNPRPEKKELKEFYSSKGGSGSVDHSRKSRINRFQKGLALINAFTEVKGKILDVGCSTGEFLKIARDCGWEAYGNDVDSESIRLAKERYSLDVKEQDLMECNFADNYFDVVTFFDSLEHIPDPLATLQEVRRILKQNGLVLITTPNIEGLFPKVTYILFAKTIGAWEHPTPPAHLYQFSMRTISKLLNRAGFSVVGFKSDQIPAYYTAGKLENAIIDAIKGKKTKFLRISSQESKQDGQQNTFWSLLVRRLLRMTIRTLSWILIIIIYPIAGLYGKGDSMIVIAKKTGARRL